MNDRTLNDDDLAGFARRIAFRSRETLEAKDRAWVYLPDFSEVVIAEALQMLKTIVQHERAQPGIECHPIELRGHHGYRVRVPEGTYLELCYRSEQGAVQFVQLKAHPELGSSGIDGLGHDVIDGLRAQPAPVVAAPAPTAERTTAPCQGYGPIPWSLHLKAYGRYVARYGEQKALIEGYCRGGFHTDELDEFVPGWRDEISEITQLRAEVARLKAVAAPAETPTWQPMDTHDGSDKPVLLRIQLGNGSNPVLATVIGFFARAGTVDMDTEQIDLVDENGYNADAAWFSESHDRDPYAMMLHYKPLAWMPLPSPPSGAPTP